MAATESMSTMAAAAMKIHAPLLRGGAQPSPTNSTGGPNRRWYLPCGGVHLLRCARMLSGGRRSYEREENESGKCSLGERGIPAPQPSFALIFFTLAGP